MTGIPLCIFPASLWWVLEPPPVAQSDTICAITPCHKLVPSHQERYPWTPYCWSSFFPVELSKFENITRLEGIVFAQCFWQRHLLGQHSRDWYSDFRHSADLSCSQFEHFASEAFKSLCLTRFASCHSNLLNILVNELWSHFKTLLHILY